MNNVSIEKFTAAKVKMNITRYELIKFAEYIPEFLIHKHPIPIEYIALSQIANSILKDLENIAKKISPELMEHSFFEFLATHSQLTNWLLFLDRMMDFEDTSNDLFRLYNLIHSTLNSIMVTGTATNYFLLPMLKKPK